MEANDQMSDSDRLGDLEDDRPLDLVTRGVRSIWLFGFDVEIREGASLGGEGRADLGEKTTSDGRRGQ